MVVYLLLAFLLISIGSRRFALGKAYQPNVLMRSGRCISIRIHVKKFPTVLRAEPERPAQVRAHKSCLFCIDFHAADQVLGSGRFRHNRLTMRVLPSMTCRFSMSTVRTMIVTTATTTAVSHHVVKQTANR